MKNFIKHIKMSTLECAEARKQLCVVKNLIFLGVTAILALCVFLLAGCERTEKDVREYIKGTSEIEVPTDSELVYLYYQTYFQDLDPQYTVFQFETDPLEWLNENDFSREKNNEFESYFNGAVHSWAETPFPEEYIPTFSGSYFWLKTKFVYFIYSPDNKWLTVFITEF